MSAKSVKVDQSAANSMPSERVSLNDDRNLDAPNDDTIPFRNGNVPTDQLYRRMISESRHQALVYTVAGVLFALQTGWSSFIAFSQTQINYLHAAAHPSQLFFMFWTFAWPTVLTINIVAANSRLYQWLTVLFYFMVLVALGGLTTLTNTEASVRAANVLIPAWSGETPIRLIAKWNSYNLAPTLLLIAFRNRRVRAVAPLVLSFMTVVSTGILGIITAAFYYHEKSVAMIILVSKTLGVTEYTAFFGYYIFLIIIACLSFGVVGWLLINWIRRAYIHKSVSDQSLEVDAYWLIFVSFYAVMMAFAGIGWALSTVVAFVIFKIVVRFGNNWSRFQSKHLDYGPALLVLRVFSLGKRSEVLFDAVTCHWRHIGNVRLIAGTDLALSTVVPHQFLSFVSGKLSRLFISSEAAIDHNLAELDTKRDCDGRFRINDFFCNADTWRNVLTRLIKSTDLVSMDLRSFSENNAGCIFEIKELLNTVPIRRLIFVVDYTTDKAFLRETLEESCRELCVNAPNQQISASSVQQFELKSSGDNELQCLLRRLCSAVDQENWGHV